MRDWFENAGVLICRPGSGSESTFGAVIKGGHNDVGSFVVVLGNEPVIIDPGSEVYTARTFGSRRYESNLLNSYGHFVPVVGGKLQETGAQAKATIVATEFSEIKDTIVLDLTSAYIVSSLKELTRTFVYSREDQGSVTITDKVSFASRQTFSTALIIPGAFIQVDENSLLIFTLKGAVKVVIDTRKGAFRVTTDIIQEQSVSAARPTRIGITVKRTLYNYHVQCP